MERRRCCGPGNQRGYFAVLCLNISWLVCTGLFDGLGVLLPTLIVQLQISTGLAGWIISLLGATACIAGIFSGPLEVMFGIRPIVMASGFMIGASMILASLTNNPAHFTLILVLLSAPGLGISVILTRALVGSYFDKDYAVANAIGSLGYSAGFIIIGPATQFLLDTYGWKGALAILGAFSLHLGACGGLLHPPPKGSIVTMKSQYVPVSQNCNETVKCGQLQTKKASLDTLLNALTRLKNGLRLSIVCRFTFWAPAIILGCFRTVPRLWLIYLLSQAQSRSFSGNDAVIFISASGIGNFIGKIFFAVLVGRGIMSLRFSLSLCIITSSTALLLNPWMSSYWLMMANTFVFNGMSGSVCSLVDLYVRELLGIENLIAAFGLMEMLGAVMQLTLGFLPGWVYDQSGSYNFAFVILGGALFLPLISLSIEWFLMRRKEQ